MKFCTHYFCIYPSQKCGSVWLYHVILITNNVTQTCYIWSYSTSSHSTGSCMILLYYLVVLPGNNRQHAAATSSASPVLPTVRVLPAQTQKLSSTSKAQTQSIRSVSASVTSMVGTPPVTTLSVTDSSKIAISKSKSQSKPKERRSSHNIIEKRYLIVSVEVLGT